MTLPKETLSWLDIFIVGVSNGLDRIRDVFHRAPKPEDKVDPGSQFFIVLGGRNVPLGTFHRLDKPLDDDALLEKLKEGPLGTWDGE